MSNLSKRDDLPPELRNALEAAARKLERSYIAVCHVMQTLCYDSIHDTNSDDHKDCTEALSEWLRAERWSPDESNEWHFRFKRLEIQEGVPWGGRHSGCTQSFAFKTCFDYLVKHIAIDVRSIFVKLMEVAVRHEKFLKQSPIAWTETQVLRLIRDHQPKVVEWVHKACDRLVTSPWQARLFLTMQPAGSTPYDLDRAMERMDPASSLKLVEALVDKLEDCIKAAAEDAYLELAKHPPAGKTIDGKVVEASTQRAPESQARPEAFDRKKLIETVLKGTPLYYDQAAFLLKISLRTLQNWLVRKKLKSGKVRSAKLKRAVNRSMITSESIKRWLPKEELASIERELALTEKISRSSRHLTELPSN